MEFKVIVNKVVLTVVLGCACEASARMMNSNEVETAAVSWLRTSAVARSVLPGRSIGTMERRGGVWLIRLTPSGYAILTSSDEAPPVVAFSGKDFVEPERGSSFYDILHGAEIGYARLLDEDAGSATGLALRSVRTYSSASAADRSAHRKARWSALLGAEHSVTNRGLRLAQSSAVPQESVIVEPFLPFHWNQWQPWNDLAPVHDADGTGTYRGRCPCGCTVTAAAQVFAYWKWPAYADGMGISSGVFRRAGESVADEWLMRFDGRKPLQWTGLPTNDVGCTNWGQGCDLRGTVSESVRYSLARIVFLCDALAQISFAPNGSSASFRTVADNAMWYETGRWVDPRYDYDDAVSALRSDLVNRMPVQVTVPGHAVVGCGWAEDSGDHYIYLNYGWSGSNDGYYNMDDAWSSSPVEEAYVGFRPKRMVQIDPIPKVVVDSAKVSWSLPETYASEVSGFEVSIRPWVQTNDWRLCDDSGIAFGSISSDCVDISEEFAPTDRSELSFDLTSSNMLNHVISLQVQCCGTWKTLVVPPLNSFNFFARKTRVTCDLGGFCGERIRLRFVNAVTGGYYSSGSAGISDIRVSDVLCPSADATRVSVPASVRQYVCRGLAAGNTYSISVRPLISGGLVSASVSCRTAGDAMWPCRRVTVTRRDVRADDEGDGRYWSFVTSVTNREFVQTCPYDGGFAVRVPGWFTGDSLLRFGLRTQSYWGGGCSDSVTVSFYDADGGRVELWSTNACADIEQRDVEVPLGLLKDRGGTIRVDYRHEGAQYASTEYGARFSNVRLCNMLIRDSGEGLLACSRKSPTSSVSIDSVFRGDRAAECGLFFECARGLNRFSVVCSSNVVRLVAKPSHVTLIDDSCVAIRPLGNGRFELYVDGSDIADSSDRSRMILTMVASDENGTQAVEDLLLRFSGETAPMPLDFHCLRFDVGDACGDMGNFAVRSGTVAKLPISRSVSEGRTFAGWRSSDNGKRYDDGMLIFNLAEPGETVTMTAIWE